MALEHLLSNLEQQFSDMIATLRSQAADRISQIQAETEIQSQLIRQQALDAAQIQIRTDASQSLNRARQEAQQIRLDARNQLIDTLFCAVQEELARARQRPDYPALLALLAQEVMAELGLPVRLAIDPQDLAAIQPLLQELGGQVSLETVIAGWGGVVGHTPDGRIAVDNRLESRFGQAQERFSGVVAELLEREMGCVR